MILRLWRALLVPGAEAELLRRLRALVTHLEDDPDGPDDFTYGFRHEARSTEFLSLSVWRDFATLLSATDGDLSKPVKWMGLEDLYDAASATTYERLPPKSPRLRLADARVLGVVAGAVKPNSEALAQSMIDRSADAALEAGALAVHRARRVVESTTEIIVVVVWPDRETMTRFVRARSQCAIDRRFTDLLTSWTFETYDTLDPARLLLPPAGPAILVVDGTGALAEVTPGVERIFGIADVLLLGRALSDVLGDPASAADFIARVRRRADTHGTTELRRPDGSLVPVRYRAAANLPSDGLCALVVELPDEPANGRGVEELVRDALRPGGAQRGTTAAS
jgi:PAS domain-containing protein